MAPIPRRQRALLAVLGWLLLSSCAAVGAAAQGAEKQGDYSCENIAKVPREEQCSFIRDKCPSESLVPYAEWYFCHVAPHNVLLRTMYLVAVCSLLPLAFCLLGDTAEFYIAPIMAHVSQAIPKMRPRFAGVTFVALGNGAPDLSANIAAISAGEVVLSAGAFTGAAMFVQCVVAAELVALAGDSGIKCGGAMLRDVGVYCLAIFSVLLAFMLGQITRAFVGWAIALYVLYMVWVFAGDEWHQRGRPKPQLDGQSFKAILNRIASRGVLREASSSAGGGGGGAAANRRSSSAGGGAVGGSRGSGPPGRGGPSREDLEESLLPWVVAEEEEEEEGVDGFFEPQHNPLRVGSAPHPGPPPDFESPLPSPGSAGQRYSDGGGAAGSRSGGYMAPGPLRPRTTEMSAAPGALRGVVSADGGGRRRLSAPGFGGASGGSSSSGDGSGAAAAAAGRGWTPAVQGLARHASLPPDMMHGPSGFADRAGSSSSNARQQYAGGGRQAGGVAHPHLMSLGKQNFIDPKTYKQLVWADLADDEEEEARLEREIARQLLVGAGRSRSWTAAAGAAGSYQPPALASAGAAPRTNAAAHQQQLSGPATRTTPRASADGQQQQQQHLPGGTEEDGAFLSPFGSDGYRTGPNTPRSGDMQQPPVGWEGLGPGSKGPSMPGWQGAQQQAGYSGAHAAAGQQHHHEQQQQQQHLGAVPEVEGGGSAGDTWQQLQWQVTLGNSDEWVDAGPVRQLFRKVTFPLLLPAYLGQRLTIPFASASGYSREWLISSLLCFPLALIAYLGLLSLPGVLTACGVGVAAAVLGAVLTAWDGPGQMAVQGLGGRAAAVVPGVLAVLAFCMGVVWIDKVATEVVGIITFLAGLASLPSGVMGLTLLAWGNSLGDFFGNRAMAKAGHTSTAITACFAAPLFNMLISLACGFSSYLHKLGASSVKVDLTPEVALGCLFLIGYNVAIISVGRMCGWRLPPWFKHFARAWYGLYFVAAVASGFYQQRHQHGGRS